MELPINKYLGIKSDWWEDRASILLDAVRKDEEELAAVYDVDHVNRSIVHTREDMVLVVSYLNAVNKQLAQLRHTRALLSIIVVLVAVGLWRVW